MPSGSIKQCFPWFLRTIGRLAGIVPGSTYVFPGTLGTYSEMGWMSRPENILLSSHSGMQGVDRKNETDIPLVWLS